MNRNYTQFSFPQVKPMPWKEVFIGVTFKGNPMPSSALSLIKSMLVFRPLSRIDPLDALGHEFFASLRTKDARLPNGRSLPPLFNFTDNEKVLIKKRGKLAQTMAPWIKGDQDEE